MKTLEETLGLESRALDCRDKVRLLAFVPSCNWHKIGFELKEGSEISSVAADEFTEERVLAHLKADLEFAFSKALGKRGISASLMRDVIKMWLWILDDPLADVPDSDYAQYGLPLLKQVAVKYGLPNPIGEDYGNEARYSAEGEYPSYD
jgi:hypothetical protein